MAKYLDGEGVETLWGKVKSYANDGVANLKTLDNTWTGANNFTGTIQKGGVNVATVDDISNRIHYVDNGDLTLQSTHQLVFAGYGGGLCALTYYDTGNEKATTFKMSDIESGKVLRLTSWGIYLGNNQLVSTDELDVGSVKLTVPKGNQVTVITL